MNPFEQFIYQVATDSEFRCQIQNNSFLATGLSQEEKNVLSSLRHLFRLSTEDLQQALSESKLLVGWF